MSSNTASAPAAEEASFVERLASIDDLSEHGDHMARYRFALQWASGSRMLDVCCGIGYGTFLLAAGGGAHVRGVDISEEAVATAKRQPALSNLTFELRDACAGLPEAGTWDVVTCFEGIEHVPAPEQLLRNIYKAVRPGGLAIVSTPNAEAYAGGHSGNPFHISEMTADQFRALVGQHPWKSQWYAQVGCWIWSRPRWQQALVQVALRLKGEGNAAPASGLRQPESVDPLAALDVDAGYPMPWKRAVAISKTPPMVILAVCQKPLA